VVGPVTRHAVHRPVPRRAPHDDSPAGVLRPRSASGPALGGGLRDTRRLAERIRRAGDRLRARVRHVRDVLGRGRSGVAGDSRGAARPRPHRLPAPATPRGAVQRRSTPRHDDDRPHGTPRRRPRRRRRDAACVGPSALFPVREPARLPPAPVAGTRARRSVSGRRPPGRPASHDRAWPRPVGRGA